MNKLKLIIISAIMLIFTLFAANQISTNGNASYFKGFIVTFLFMLIYFVIITVYYIAVKNSIIKKHNPDLEIPKNPLDTWLIGIPICIIMVLSFTWLKWQVTEVFICTFFSLSGMVFGNTLGRGNKRWSLAKSFPFFLGCGVSIYYGIVFGGMMV